ncbi:MAG: hypothetical protein D6769_02100 [Methanobacteriota archaeon]|nr:MAG: hypothetical protein D6769_02100 [Euryarchaeota archaeon]
MAKDVNDYRSYYKKLFSSLSKEEESLLMKLINDENCSLTNSIEMGGSKEELLTKAFVGPSLDIIESKGSLFKLKEVGEVDKVEHFIAFISNLSLECPAERAMDVMDKLEKKQEGGPYYSSFVFHSTDKKDYVLLAYEG